MFKSFRQDGNDLELIDEEQFTIFKDETEVAIKLGKTKTKKYLVIQAQYENNNQIDSFQTKLTLNNLREKSKHFSIASNIDESFILFVNLFEIKEVWVKDILNKNYLKLVFNFQKKDLEINLAYKKVEKNIFFHKSKALVESTDNIDDNLNINDNKKGNKINEIKEEEDKIEDKDEEKEKKNDNEKNEDVINNTDDNDKNNEINENKIENEDEILDNNINKEWDKINSIAMNNDNNYDDNTQENQKVINDESNENNKEIENIIINDIKIIEDNKIEINEQGDEKGDIINNNSINSKDILNGYNLKELLEKIKHLEEENKKLKEENEQLKQKILENELNKDKLKKSEKEKENLKIELQKLRALNQKNNSDKQNKIFTNESLRQHPMILSSKNDIKKIEEKENKIINNNIIEELFEERVIQKKKFESKSPINLRILKTITQSTYLPYSIDNTFDVFTSLKDELFLVYSTKIKSIECFDLIKHKFHKTILNAHNGQILTIRHYCPEYIKKDMILSGSNGDYAVKIWDVETWSCIFNISKVYQSGIMFSICILFDEYQKESFIFTSSDKDYIKMWSMDEKFVKNISKTNINEKFFIDTYYDNKEYKYYLISGEMRCVKVYELNLNQLFRTYMDNNSYSEHLSAFIYDQEDTTRLVESEFYGTVRIWNFHTGNIIQKIEVCRRTPLVSLCLWNENYLLVSCVDNTIKLVDFKNYALIKSFTGHRNEVCTIKKIIHPTYGECLFSQGLVNEQIKMWING